MTKTIFLNLVFLVFSIVFGLCLGNIDIFGFIDSRQFINIAFIALSMLSIYVNTIILFLLNFSKENNKLAMFLIASLCFSIAFLIASFNLINALLLFIIYFAFINFTENAVLHRSSLFIKFMPNEIFFPVIKKGVFYILIFFSAITFFQTNEKVVNNKLITPSMLKIILKPAVETFNSQFNSQLKIQLGNKYQFLMASPDRDKTIKLIVKESIKPILTSDIKKFVSINPRQINYDNLIVKNNGEIDVSLIIENLYPEVSTQLNQKIQTYAILIPLGLALLVFIFLRPLFWIISPIEFGLTYVIFKFLIYNGFITIEKKQMEVERVSL